MATTVTSRTASRTASATAPPAITITITAAAGASVTRTFRTHSARLYRRDYSVHTVEVRLIVRIELCAALDHCRGRGVGY
jgi:hypothetical protein